MSKERSLTSAVACYDPEPKPHAPSHDAIPAATLEAPAEAAADVTARLAKEFVALAEEFPQFCRPDQLPEGVLDTAAKTGISLLDAYLRHRLREEKRVAAAAEMRRRAAAYSAGSLSRGAVETPPEQDAFLRAFRAAL